MSDIPPDLTWERAAPPDATGPGPWIELAFGEGDDGEAPVYIRETSDPENVVTTNRRKWDAFVLGVQAGEFDHFVEGVEDATDTTAAETTNTTAPEINGIGPDTPDTPDA
ncbi:DUF397 domain-containing protein [Streptomyces prunicolor]|uniref:DUF397 domain-containing protein n=1 Tax=Streptomyces prunicolor TaxID=67348 RepID=A0ABU4FKK0_9ACTN|nr:DUF397 domain-containing protein [Streptomyces prunicolor]MDV7221112.1 DUF397 domain-containing protein [Streptomyces prunicolor]